MYYLAMSNILLLSSILGTLLIKADLISAKTYIDID